MLLYPGPLRGVQESTDQSLLHELVGMLAFWAYQRLILATSPIFVLPQVRLVQEVRALPAVYQPLSAVAQ